MVHVVKSSGSDTGEMSTLLGLSTKHAKIWSMKSFQYQVDVGAMT